MAPEELPGPFFLNVFLGLNQISLNFFCKYKTIPYFRIPV